uniref:Endonuclease/exonuclease/phosphatase domain-containing protein n=1 Tax=Timema tahoe TaxID=61484 RepID=A0A7R9IAH5_9NEOP|nr:unnamed protein product [Timema tahoe]
MRVGDVSLPSLGSRACAGCIDDLHDYSDRSTLGHVIANATLKCTYQGYSPGLQTHGYGVYGCIRIVYLCGVALAHALVRCIGNHVTKLRQYYVSGGYRLRQYYVSGGYRLRRYYVSGGYSLRHYYVSADGGHGSRNYNETVMKIGSVDFDDIFVENGLVINSDMYHKALRMRNALERNRQWEYLEDKHKHGGENSVVIADPFYELRAAIRWIGGWTKCPTHLSPIGLGPMSEGLILPSEDVVLYSLAGIKAPSSSSAGIQRALLPSARLQFAWRSLPLSLSTVMSLSLSVHSIFQRLNRLQHSVFLRHLPTTIANSCIRQSSSEESGLIWTMPSNKNVPNLERATGPSVPFRVLSYNVLSQALLEEHTYLYQYHDKIALNWHYRKKLLMAEIRQARAHRTHGKVDGVAVYYRADMFDLYDYTTVEFFQPGVRVLDRDNVGLVVKLCLRGGMPAQQIVVATTHLLFNSRRHDVKLAQTQLLLTEIERFAFQGVSQHRPKYLPVIITGDMNLEPHTGVYQLLTQGRLNYGGLSKKLLDNSSYGPILGNTLIPRNLHVMDTCQHWGVMATREGPTLDHAEEWKHIKLYNSDRNRLMKESASRKRNVESSFQQFVENVRNQGKINDFVTVPRACPALQPTLAPPPDPHKFETGQLSHHFNLQSVYSHDREVTTNQGDWVTVDYIFYSSRDANRRNQNPRQVDLRLVARYSLPSEESAEKFGSIPNLASPSDHYPLLAEFHLTGDQ